MTGKRLVLALAAADVLLFAVAFIGPTPMPLALVYHPVNLAPIRCDVLTSIGPCIFSPTG